MDQTSGTIPPEAPTQGRQDGPPVEAAATEQPGFGSRGRIRRRARFLRRARELAYRDLGGLVFNLHRFGERNDSLVLAKLATLSHIDTELRTLERALGDRHPITVLREAGITACPRCAAIHGSEDRFCLNCGLPLSRDVDLPIATPGASAGVAAPAPAASPAESPAPDQGPAPAPGPPAPPGAPSAGGSPEAPPPGDPPTETMPAPAPAAASAVPAGGGRAPVPPARGTPPKAPAPGTPQVVRSSGPDEVTEILHPPAAGQ